MRARRPLATAARAAVLALAGLTALVAGAGARAAGTDEGDCADGRPLEHAFDSGALWSLCARLDDVHGLEVTDLRYRAPGDTRRPVLRALHLAQLLLHYHDEPLPERRLGGATPETRGLGGTAAVPLDAASCDGTALALETADAATAAPATLCTRERPGGILVKYAQRPAVHGERFELFAVARQGPLTWRVAVALTEDGEIVPSLALSGRVERRGDDPRFGTALDDGAFATRATLLAAWRLDVALDTPAPDRVEELDFPLETALEQRRPMRVRALSGEAFRSVAPERFRRWRVVDGASGAGYLLDPIDSALRWNARGDDWPRFALAVTRPRACERHAAANAAGDTACGAGLDAFVDAETLDGADPVLWFSRTRLWSPRREDLPFLSSISLAMRLTPFDWTASSPFETNE